VSERRHASYSDEQLALLATILERKAPNVAIDCDVLRKELVDLMSAVGRADDGSEQAVWFREAGANMPSGAALAEQFRRIAAAEDPLDPELCSGIALTMLNAAVRRRWTSRVHRKERRPTSLRGVSTSSLSAATIGEIREMAFHLAGYHRSSIRSGHPGNLDQDTLLEGVAVIYINFANLDCHRHDLPHSQNSLFIRFAYTALRPFFGLTEASRKALSNRWKRLKDQASSVV
jgi:hypothetical protein